MQSSRSVVLVLLLVQVLFGTLPISVKFALRDLSSPSLALLRVVGAAALFIVLHRVFVREKIRTRADYGRLALYALFGVVLNQLLYITALTLTTATAAQTIITAGPAFTLLVAILLHQERGTAAKWAGIGLSAAGTLLLVGFGATSGTALGNFLALLNVAAFSIYQVISRGILRRYDPLTVITWVFVFGAVGLLPWGMGPVLSDIPRLTMDGALALGWTIVIPTVGGYYLHVWALKRAESSTVAVWVCLQPIVTALLATWLLGEHLPARLLPAGALILLGVLLTVREGRRLARAQAGAVERSRRPRRKRTQLAGSGTGG